MEEFYFYTTLTPHRYTSGPSFHSWGPNGRIASLEEAKALADEKRVASTGDDRCVTTYGVYYKTEDESFKRL